MGEAASWSSGEGMLRKAVVVVGVVVTQTKIILGQQEPNFDDDKRFSRCRLSRWLNIILTSGSSCRGPAGWFSAI